MIKVRDYCTGWQHRVTGYVWWINDIAGLAFCIFGKAAKKMTLAKVRQKFHRLIDKIDDVYVLLAFYQFIELQQKEDWVLKGYSEVEKKECFSVMKKAKVQQI